MSTVFEQSIEELEPWIRAELQDPGTIGRGARNKSVRRIQEWLTLHGHSVVVDDDFGPATEAALKLFQGESGLGRSGKLDTETWRRLTRPMRGVLHQQLDHSSSFGQAALTYARAHLKVHPREVGGSNRGPWVRLYMQGNEGAPWAWCAGFVTFLQRQAADSLGSRAPIAGSFSCDVLATQAKTAGKFLSESSASPREITPGSLFLVRSTATDWTHTGMVVSADAEKLPHDRGQHQRLRRPRGLRGVRAGPRLRGPGLRPVLNTRSHRAPRASPVLHHPHQ